MVRVAVMGSHLDNHRLLGYLLALRRSQRRALTELLGDSCVESDKDVKVDVLVLSIVVQLAVAALFALDLDVVEITDDAVNLALTQRLELLQVVAVIRLSQARRYF